MDYNIFDLSLFTENNKTPIYIAYGFHDEDLYLHKHSDFYEITIVLSGSATHLVNNKKYTVHKGDVFVVGSDLAHGYENPQNFKICNVMYKPDFLYNLNFDIQESKSFHSLFVLEPQLRKDDNYIHHLELSVETFKKVNEIIAELVQEYQKPEMGHNTFIISMFLNLVVQLTRAYEVQDKPPSLLKLAEPLAYINKNYNQAVTINDLAQLAHMSERNFSRVFKSTYGVSPINYIIQLRIQQAYELLKDKNLSVLEVSSSCGFADSNYFSRQFKLSSGFSPSEYRKVVLKF